jgi:hypothetical protein
MRARVMSRLFSSAFADLVILGSWNAFGAQEEKRCDVKSHSSLGLVAHVPARLGGQVEEFAGAVVNKSQLVLAISCDRRSMRGACG